MDLYEEMNKSEIIQKCHNLIGEISERYSYFTDEFSKMHKGEISLDELKNNFRNRLQSMTQIEQEEYNYMAKMFSECNCGWQEYRTGRLVHDELMKIWYPKECD